MQLYFFKTQLLLWSILCLLSCKNKETPTPGTHQEYTLKIDQDISISMRDGIMLSANIYRPDAPGKFPVIVSLGPYGKDNLPAHYDPINDGIIQVSKYAAFETPDPEFWVKQGYVVIAADSRGAGKSDGKLNLLEDKEAEDYYDLIEWAGVQNWSSGKVGLNGVSYFGISQWKVAALHPPHLKAMICWEGFTDAYRDVFYHGGIPSKFIDLWYPFSVLKNLSPSNTGYRDLITEVNTHPLSSAKIYTDLNTTPVLSKITIPAYIAVSVQDHGLHTRGTINGFKKIASKYKWLELYGRKKWEYYYGADATSRQKKFFDHFLKGMNNDMLAQATVRYEMREAYYKGNVEMASHWPLPHRNLKKLYLDAHTKTLDITVPSQSTNTSYDATPLDDPELIKDHQRVVFKHTFVQDTKVVGSMKLNLLVSSDQADDIDLFVGIQKADVNGNIVYFEGPSHAQGQVASGWLRVSKRALDINQTTEEIPYHTHDLIQKITPGEKVEVQIEIWPTTTKFNAGEQLLLVIQGSDIPESQESHKNNVNKGHTTIHTGDTQALSFLQIPIL